MSPRRSSRARTTQPSPLIPNQTTSSNSSVTSDRAQRATRSNIKPTSPQRSVPRAQSQDETADDGPKPPPRRTRSGATDIREPSPLADDNLDEEEDDGQDENEVTRCVCGHAEFPGMSRPLQDILNEVDYTPTDGNAIGDFFVQCDACKVWQHGGCVSIVDQDHSPDEYFCEECSKDLHKVLTSPEGQRYSRYNPVISEPPYPQSPKQGSRAGKGKEKPRQSTETMSHKRRQTLNSRYDLDELERAIEESKKDSAHQGAGSAASATTLSRPTKRTRDESYEYVPADSSFADSYPDPKLRDSGIDVFNEADAVDDRLTLITKISHKPSVSNKRQRTDSQSPALEPKAEDASETEPAEPASELTPKSKIRGAAARNHQAKEAREAKERQRLAAANARQARSERRRGDESDVEEGKEDPIPSTAASSPPPEAPSSIRTAKKKVAPVRRGRGAKNQQGQEQESPIPEADDNLLSLNPHNTRARSRSRSVVREDVEETSRGIMPNGATPNTRGGLHGRDATSTSRVRDTNGIFDDGGLLSKPSKVKNFNEKRTSLNEMRKRVAAISEFVGRAQVERPPSKSTSMSRSESEGGGSGSGNTSGGNGSANTNSTTTSDVNGTLSTQRKKQLQDIINNDSAPEFGSLSTEEMLENMRLRTQAWQELYGKYGDK